MRNFFRNIKTTLLIIYHRAFKVEISTYLSFSSKIDKSLVMGKFGYIGPRSIISKDVIIGKYVMIGPELTITGNDHLYNIPGCATIFSGRPPKKNVT